MDGISHRLKTLCDNPSRKQCFEEAKHALTPLEFANVCTSPLMGCCLEFFFDIFFILSYANTQSRLE
jgi:hypothetical protein